MTGTDGLAKADVSSSTMGCRLVAIGSSAGGLIALRTLFEKLPPDLGVAFVVITHLNPDQPSGLVSILSKSTRMPVSEVGKSVPIEPNHIYVIAPNRQLVVEDSVIGTEPFAEPRGLRAPIDWFFRSLAERHRDGFGIVLSGGGSDGTVGIRAMKGAGAVILVQDPKEAEFPWMPRNAIATGCVDAVAPVAELAEKLVQLIRNQKNVDLKQTGIKANDTVRQILAYLHARTGQDFSGYKAAAILRRLTRRMQLNNLQRIEDYDVYLRNNPEEVQALFGDFLISVTNFFRDPETFQALSMRVVPELVSKSLNTPLRVWVPGCATGEEVYSLTIVLLEEMARQGQRELQIFATDIDAYALDKAREGLYPAVIENDVSEERLQRFFTREGYGYRINRAVRNAVIFAHHSLLSDAPFSKVDLISCRNLLIHLEPDAQKRVLAMLHYALNPGGYLFLGADETAETEPDFFRAVDRKHRIYQALLRTPKPLLEPSRLSLRATATTMPRTQPFSHAALAVAQADVHLQALEEFAPPNVLVDANHHMLHLSENAGRFMQHPSGPPSTNIVELIRPELKPELTRALHSAFERGESSLSMAVPVEFNHATRRVSIHVLPVKAEGAVSRALVLFLDGGPFEHAGHALPAQTSQDEASAIITRLSEEVDFTQQQLRESRAEYASANEELRASNEELVSANEEYRATAEELEASKEELQSMNEELLTLNGELKTKIDNISLANANLQNLMAAMDGGTLFIDADLCITFFTPAIVHQFNIAASDIGRPITDFTHRLKYTELGEDARAVLRNLTPIQREIESTFDEWFLMRMRPYRKEGRVEGAAITFIDVTQLHRAEEALKESEARYRALVTTSSSAIFRMSQDWKELRELDGHGFVEDTTNPSMNWLDTYVDPSDQPEVKAAIEKAMQTKSTFMLEHRIKLAGGKLGWAFSRAVPRMDAKGEIVEWFGAISDLTEYHRVQDELAQSRRIETVGRLVGGVAHDFNNLLTVITANLELAEQAIEDEPIRELIDRAAKAAELGASFNKRLVSMAGKHRYEPQCIKLDTHIADTAVLLRRALGEKITLCTELAPHLWPANVDPLEIDSALLNLALNARDAMPRGGKIVFTAANVTLDAKSAAAMPNAKPGDYICLGVTDTGVGMTSETLSRATEAFFSTKHNLGTGLGLFSVQAFAKQAGGFIHLASKLGVGTTVSLYLPRATTEASHEHAHGEGNTPIPRGHGELVLVVEDDEGVRDVARRILERLGYTVVEAGTATEAMELLTPESKFSLVFSDIVLSDKISGIDLARWIKAERPRIKVLLTSGYSIEAAAEPDAGLNVKVLPKPYSRMELGQVIQTVLGHISEGSPDHASLA